LLSKDEIVKEKKNCAPNEGEPKATGESANQNKSYTTIMTNPGTIALRTIPAYLKNGKRRIKVNPLLDDVSTKTYINSDVAAELRLQGQLQRVNVSVLNGHVEAFETSPIECMIESLDGKTTVSVTALTANRVTGGLKVFDWKSCAEKWDHLLNLEFPKLGSRPTVDIHVLIGFDCADFHFSFKDIHGAPGQLVACLTPLGWTCIGATANEIHHTNATANFAYMFFL